MRALRNLAAAAIAIASLAAAEAPEVKFSPVEAYTIVYDVTGAQTGTYTHHSRKFGHEQSQINDLALGPNVRNRLQLMNLADKIVSYDPLTRRAGSTANPGYARLVMAATGKSDADLPKALLQALSFTPTGRTQNLAGETCMLWESRTLQQARCVTDDGIMLQTRLNLPGAAIVQTARTVRRGDPGPDAAYQVPAGIQVQPVANMKDLPGVGG